MLISNNKNANSKKQSGAAGWLSPMSVLLDFGSAHDHKVMGSSHAWESAMCLETA